MSRHKWDEHHHAIVWKITLKSLLHAQKHGRYWQSDQEASTKQKIIGVKPNTNEESGRTRINTRSIWITYALYENFAVEYKLLWKLLSTKQFSKTIMYKTKFFFCQKYLCKCLYLIYPSVCPYVASIYKLWNRNTNISYTCGVSPVYVRLWCVSTMILFRDTCFHIDGTCSNPPAACLRYIWRYEEPSSIHPVKFSHIYRI